MNGINPSASFVVLKIAKGAFFAFASDHFRHWNWCGRQDVLKIGGFLKHMVETFLRD